MICKAFLLLMCWTGAVSAADLDDRHLPVVARTAAETARVALATQPTTNFGKPEPFEALPGGAATVPASGKADALSRHSGNMDGTRTLDFELGNGLFRKNWVAAPASTLASDGLGPLFNARACQDCHIKDGRGPAPTADTPSASLVLRLSIPGEASPEGITDYLATAPDPTYGAQLQDRASPRQIAEGRLTLRYTPLAVALADGSTVTLQEPHYSIENPAYGAISPGLMMSPRLAPQMTGLGLLEAVATADILALADETDANGDGISGRANIVWSADLNAPMLGRFGLKAGVPTLRQQSAAALSIDMGLSNALFPDPAGDCTDRQQACRTSPNGQQPDLRDGLEVDHQSLDLITFYARNLAPPARRDAANPQVLAGKQVFYALGCQTCHQPKFVTNRLRGLPEQSFQLIWPYTDLLLHDMGEGLSDNRSEARATGQEWRTAPLWGIGLAQQVNPRAGFLHDGRARTLTEAILWHGGEALAARNAMIALPKPDRDTLIKFLESL